MKLNFKNLGIGLITVSLLISCTGEKKKAEITAGSYLPLSSQELRHNNLNLDSKVVYYTDNENPFRVYRANKNTDGSAEIQTGSFSLEISQDKKTIKFSEMSLKAGKQNSNHKIDEFTANDLGMLEYQNPQAQTKEYRLESSLYKLKSAAVADLSGLDSASLKTQSMAFLSGQENEQLNQLTNSQASLKIAENILENSEEQSIRMSLLEGGLIQISIQNKKGNAIASEPVVYYYQKVSPEHLQKVNSEFLKDLNRMAKAESKLETEENKNN